MSKKLSTLTVKKIKKETKELSQQIIDNEKPMFATVEERENLTAFSSICSYYSMGYFTLQAASSMVSKAPNFVWDYIQSRPEMRPYFEKAKTKAERAKLELLQKSNEAFNNSLGVTKLKKSKKRYEVVNGKRTLVEDVIEEIEQAPNETNYRLILSRLTELHSNTIQPVQLGAILIQVLEYLQNSGVQIDELIPLMHRFALNYNSKNQQSLNDR